MLGAAHVTSAERDPARATGSRGLPGTVLSTGTPGVAGEDAGEVTAAMVMALLTALAAELPAEFFAVTVNVYEVPALTARPPGPTAARRPPSRACDSGAAAIEYDVTGPPPSDVGAVHVTVAAPLPGWAFTCCGAPGGRWRPVPPLPSDGTTAADSFVGRRLGHVVHRDDLERVAVAVDEVG